MSGSYECVSLGIYVDTDTRVVVKITKMTGTCRLCLKESTKLSPIFCNSQGRKNFFDLYRKIFICCGIDINEYDELSSFICNECVTKLNAAYDFRLICQRSYSEYCRLQAPHASKNCACLNSNAGTEVQKIIEICQSTDIDGNNFKEVAEASNNFQVNGVSTINSDGNQANGLSGKNADEKNGEATDVSMTNSLDVNKSVGSKLTGDSINHESSESLKENEDINNLSYEKRIEIVRHKYKDALILNKLNIPPRKGFDTVKATDINSNVTGTKQKDAVDASSLKNVYNKDSQVEDNNSNINQTLEATVPNKNISIDKNAEQQIDADGAADVQTNFVEESDHSYGTPGEIIALAIDDNEQIKAIFYKESCQKTAEGINEEFQNTGDQSDSINAHQLDNGNQVCRKDGDLVVKDVDSSIEKPKKYSKNISKVPNKNNIKIDKKDKNLSLRKRSRSKVDVPAVKQYGSKRRKSAKTPKFISKEESDDDHQYVSREDNVHSGHSIEVQAEVHIRDQSPKLSVVVNESNTRVYDKNKSQSVDVTNGQNRLTINDFDQISSLDDIAIEVAHNIEILPDNVKSVDYTVGIPDDDINSSDDTQVPNEKNLVTMADDNDTGLDDKKNCNTKGRKKKQFKNFKPLVNGKVDNKKNKKDQVTKNNDKNNKKFLNKKINKSVKVIAVRKLQDKGKYKIRFPFKRLKSKDTEYQSIHEEEDESNTEDNGDKSSKIPRLKQSTVKQLSSSGNKKLNKSQYRKSGPTRPSNSGRMEKKQVCKYCDKSFLYRLPLIKHMKTQHSDDIDKKSYLNSSPVKQIQYKNCQVVLRRL